ncbi:MAG: hypothetical protein IIZ13_06230 [Renibacterium sp.]|nr:hypothetical protein [Renibacterium sp.]
MFYKATTAVALAGLVFTGLPGNSAAAEPPASPATYDAVENFAPVFSDYTTLSGLFTFKLPVGYFVLEKINEKASAFYLRQVMDIHIYSPSGQEVAFLAERYWRDGVGGPFAPEQTVLAQAKTANMSYSPGDDIDYRLTYNRYPDFTDITMRLEDREIGGYGVAAEQFEVAGNGISVFRVNVGKILGDDASIETVRQWQETPQYAQLETMLTSLRANI